MKYTSNHLKALARRSFASTLDTAIALFPPLTMSDCPPKFMRFGGSGDFIELGDSLVADIVNKTGFGSGQSIVDIGCGIGRNATALHRKFGDGIEYHGFDTVRHGVSWCRQHFKRKSKNYYFTHVDLYNSAYNRNGKLDASGYIFPYPTASIDCVFATSVFTHMQPAVARQYINESARILKEEGCIYFTLFILDENSELAIREGKAAFSFPHSIGACRVENAQDPDGVVAYPLEWLETTLSRAGLRDVRIQRAEWRDGKGSMSSTFQDVLVARKLK